MSARMVVVLGITLYTTRAVLRVLGVEDYGIYNVVCGFVYMFAFLNTSMSNGIQRFFNYELGRGGIDGARRVYNTALVIQLLLAAFLIVVAESVGVWYIREKMVIPDGRMLAAECVFQFSLLSSLLVIMQAPYTAAVVAHERMDFFAVVSTLDAVAKLAIVFLIPLFGGDGLIVYGLMLALVSLANFMLYYSYCHTRFDEIRMCRRFHKSLFKQMLGFSGWNTIGSFSNIMIDQGINLVLNLFFGPVVNAAKGVASQVNAGINSFVSNVSMPVRPQVVQSYAKGDIDRTLRLTYGMMKLSSCIFFMLALPVCLEIDYILRLWLGANVPAHTDTFVVLVLLTTLTMSTEASLSGLVHATGRMRAYQTTGSTIKLGSVPIAYLLCRSGLMPEVALIVVLVLNATALVVSLFIVRSITCFSIRRYALQVVMPVVLTVAVSSVLPCVLRVIISTGAISLMIVATSSLLSVGTSIYYIALNSSERKVCLQLAATMRQRITHLV